MALSFQLTLVAVKVIGFWGMFLLARRFLNVGIVLATFGAALFSMSNMYYMSVTHAQLSSVAFIPWVALLGSAYCRKRTQANRSVPFLHYLCGRSNRPDFIYVVLYRLVHASADFGVGDHYFACFYCV